MSREAPPPRLPYMPGLDGLRALAVLAVFFYHLGYPWAAGGFLGVETFFVLSGYLITALLLREHAATGRLNLTRFWLRRARRLWPALWLLLAVTPLMAAAWAPDAWPRLREDLPAAFFYVTNLLYIVRQVPYFERFGRPPLLQHLWSLGVEEQFYLAWPLLLWALLVLLRVRGARAWRRLAAPLAGLAVLSALWMARLYDPLADPARVYYAPDTRAAGFAIGGLLAVLWPPGAWPRAARRADGWAGPALLGLLAAYHALDEFRPMLYRGGFAATALLTAAVLSAATVRTSLVGRVFGLRPLVWLGTRSYAFYLWHWPFIAVWRPGQECALPAWTCTLAHFGFTALAAEISYRWVEHPIRTRGVRAWARALTATRGRRALTAGLAAAWLLALAVSVPRLEARRAQAQAQAVAAVYGPMTVAAPTPTSTPPPRAVATRVAGAGPTATPAGPRGASSPSLTPTSTRTGPTPTPLPSGLWLTLLGDSVMEGTRFAWAKMWPSDRFYMLAEKNWRLVHFLPLLPDLAQEGRLAPVVVIHTGANGLFSPDTFDRVVQTLLDLGVERVYFVNVRSSVRWAPLANQRLEEGVARWPQAELLDWNAYATPHLDEWFYRDRVHLNRAGAWAYVAFILRGVGLPAPTPAATEPGHDLTPTPHP